MFSLVLNEEPIDLNAEGNWDSFHSNPIVGQTKMEKCS